MENKDLDKWLAEKVMGWIIKSAWHEKFGRLVDYYWKDENELIMPVDSFKPTENISQAFECLEEWVDQDKDRYYVISKNPDGGYEVSLFQLYLGKTSNHKLEDEICTDYAVELENAITQAIYKAMEGK